MENQALSGTVHGGGEPLHESAQENKIIQPIARSSEHTSATIPAGLRYARG